MTVAAVRLEDLSILNEFDRHIEHSELRERTLNDRAENTPKIVEEIACERAKENLKKFDLGVKKSLSEETGEGITPPLVFHLYGEMGKGNKACCCSTLLPK